MARRWRRGRRQRLEGVSRTTAGAQGRAAVAPSVFCCIAPKPHNDTLWWALVNPGQRLPVGAPINFTDTSRASGIELSGVIVEIDAEGRRLVRLTAVGTDVASAINVLGHMPLPPYIRRPDSVSDRERYQTMFAREEGSIAAPHGRSPF
jgi:S-adenosylmethionine:tRNA-ribosyltransferase-isomerase (queuine synthetase)